MTVFTFEFLAVTSLELLVSIMMARYGCYALKLFINANTPLSEKRNDL